MTIASETSRNDYTLNGATVVYPYTFRTLAAADLRVVRRDAGTGIETVLAYPAEFSVSGVGNTVGGAVTLASAGSNGDTLTIRRNRAIKQEMALAAQGRYSPADVEAGLDQGIVIAQQLQDQIDRAFTLAETVDPASVSAALPVPQADRALVWNGSATALTNRVLDASINVALPGNSRTTTTLTAYLANNAVFHILDYNPVPATPIHTGVNAADTTIANAKTAAAASGGGTIVFGPGDFLTDTVTIATDNTHFLTAGQGVTYFTFKPTVTGRALFKLTKGASPLFRNSFRGGFTIKQHASATSFQKYAFELIDTSETRIEDVNIIAWTGHVNASVDAAGMYATPSIGFFIKGRELARIIRCTVEADRPIRIGQNPNSANLNCDHMLIDCFYGLCQDPNGAHITVDANVNCTNLTVTAQQAWVLGKYGVFRDDGGGAAQVSYQVRFQGIRMEQATAGGYLCKWIANTKGGLYFDDCQAPFQGGGWYLRNVQNAEIRNCLSSNLTGEVLNLDATCIDIFGFNNHFVTGSTMSITGCSVFYESSKASGRVLGASWHISNSSIFTPPQYLSPTLTTPHIVGAVRFDDAAAWVRGGATSWSVKRFNEGADNLTVLDSGDVIARATMKATQYYVGVNPVVGPRLAAVTSPNAQTGAYVQADVQSLKTAIDTIIGRMQTHGLIS